MQKKKSPKADLERHRSLFFAIGLVVALLFLGVGLWLTSPSDGSPNLRVKEQFDLTDFDDISIDYLPIAEPLVAPEPELLSDIFRVVDNSRKIIIVQPDPQTLLELEPEIDLSSLVLPPQQPEPEKEPEPVHKIVDQMPSFEGGDLFRFRSWVVAQVRYPKTKPVTVVAGRVVVGFVIEKDGTLGQIEVVQTPHPLLSDELVRVLQLSPRWTAGKNKGVDVRVKFSMPVDFRWD